MACDIDAVKRNINKELNILVPDLKEMGVTEDTIKTVETLLQGNIPGAPTDSTTELLQIIAKDLLAKEERISTLKAKFHKNQKENPQVLGGRNSRAIFSAILGPTEGLELHNLLAEVAEMRGEAGIQSTMVENKLNTLLDQAIKTGNTKLQKLIRSLKENTNQSPLYRIFKWKQRIKAIERERNNLKALLKGHPTKTKQDKANKKQLQEAYDKLSKKVQTLREQIDRFTAKGITTLLKKNIDDIAKQIKTHQDIIAHTDNIVTLHQGLLRDKIKLLKNQWKKKQEALAGFGKSPTEPRFSMSEISKLFHPVFLDTQKINDSSFKELQESDATIDEEALQALLDAYKPFLKEGYMDDRMIGELQSSVALLIVTEANKNIELTSADQVIPTLLSEKLDMEVGKIPELNKIASPEEVAFVFNNILRRIQYVMGLEDYDGYISEGVLAAIFGKQFLDVNFREYFKLALNLRPDRHNLRRLITTEKEIPTDIIGLISTLLGRDPTSTLKERRKDHKEERIMGFDLETRYTEGYNPKNNKSSLTRASVNEQQKGIRLAQFAIQQNGSTNFVVFYQDNTGKLVKVVDGVPSGLTKSQLNDISPENVDAIIAFITQEQDNGTSIVTHNGTNFDFDMLHRFGTNKKGAKAASLRSIDLYANLKKQRRDKRGMDSRSLRLKNLTKIDGLADGVGIPHFLPKGPTGGFTFDGGTLHFNGQPITSEEETNDESYFGYALFDSLLTVKAYSFLSSNTPGSVSWLLGDTVVNEEISPVFKPTHELVKDILVNTLNTAHPVSEFFGMAPAFDIDVQNIITKATTTVINFRLEKVQLQVEKLTEAAKAIAEGKNVLEVFDVIEQTQIERSKIVTSVLSAFMRGLKPIWEAEFTKRGYPIVFNYHLDTTELVAGDPYITNKGEEGKREYINKTEEFIRERLRTISNVELEAIISSIPDFPTKLPEQSIEAFIIDNLPTYLKSKFSGFEDYSSFGDGTMGYEVAQGLGIKLVDLLSGKKEGSVTRPLEQEAPLDIPKNRNLTLKEGGPSLTPTTEAINHASVFPIEDLQQHIEEWKVFRREQFLLNNADALLQDADNLKRVEAWIKSGIKNPDPKTQLSRSLHIVRPRVSPAVLIRSPFAPVPNLLELRTMALDAVFNTPQLLEFMVHDAFYRSPGTASGLVDASTPSYYPDEYAHLHPGVNAGLMGSAAIPYSLAWFALRGSIPLPVIDLIAAQVDDVAYDKSGTKASIKTDMKFSGRHLILGMLLFGATPKQRKRIFKTLATVIDIKESSDGGFLLDGEELRDPRHELRNSVVKVLEDLPKRTAKQESLLAKLYLLGEKTEESKDLFKGVLTPRNYQGGPTAFISDLKKRNKNSDPKKVLTSGEIKELAHLAVTKVIIEGTRKEVTLADKALGLDSQAIINTEEILKKLRENYPNDFLNEKNESQRRVLIQNRFSQYVQRRAELWADSQTTLHSKPTDEDVREYMKKIEKETQDKIDRVKEIRSSRAEVMERLRREGNVLSKEDYIAFQDQTDTLIEQVIGDGAVTKRLRAIAARGATPLQLNVHNYTGPEEFKKYLDAYAERNLYMRSLLDGGASRQYVDANSSINPQDSKEKQIATEENKEGMYDVEGIHIDEERAYRDLLTELLLELSPNFPPEVLGYETKTEETEERFFKEFKQDSDIINRFRQGLSPEAFRVASMDFRFRTTLNNDDRQGAELIDYQTNPPYAAFLPTHHRMDFSQFPNPFIQRLHETIKTRRSSYKSAVTEIRNMMKQAEAGNNTMIPLQYRGHQSAFSPETLPSVPLDTKPYTPQLYQLIDNNRAFLSNQEWNELMRFAKDMGLEDSDINTVFHPRFLLVARALYTAHQSGNRVFNNKERLVENPGLLIRASQDEVNKRVSYFVGRLARSAVSHTFSIDLLQNERTVVTTQQLEKYHAVPDSHKTYKRLVSVLGSSIARMKPFRVNLIVDEGVWDGEEGMRVNDKRLPESFREFPVRIHGVEAEFLVNKILISQAFRKLFTETIQTFMTIPPADLDNAGNLKDIQKYAKHVEPEILSGILIQLANSITEESMVEEGLNNLRFIVRDNQVIGISENAKMLSTSQREYFTMATYGGSMNVDTLVRGTTHQYKATANTMTAMLNLIANQIAISGMELSAITKAAQYPYDSNLDKLKQYRDTSDMDADNNEELNRWKLMGELDVLHMLANATNPEIRHVDYGIESARGMVFDSLRYLDIDSVVRINLNLSTTMGDTKGETFQLRVRDIGVLLPVFRLFNQAKKLGLHELARELRTELIRFNGPKDASGHTQEHWDSRYGLRPGQESNIEVRAAIQIASLPYSTSPKEMELMEDSMIQKEFGDMEPEERQRLINNTKHLVGLFRTVMGSNIEHNQHYRAAYNIIEKTTQNVFDPLTESALTQQITDELFERFKFPPTRVTKNENLKEDIEVAIELAFENYKKNRPRAKPSITFRLLGKPHSVTEVKTFTNASHFLSTFKSKEAIQIHGYLKSLVDRGIISQEIMDAKLLLLGHIAINDHSFFDELYLTDADEGQNSYAKASKIAGKYTINLNANMVKVTSENEIYWKFAEELIHIASAKYHREGGAERSKITAIFATKRSKRMIKDMLSAMNNYQSWQELEDATNYAMQNADEFFAHFGAFVLVHDALVAPKALLKIRTKHKTADAAATWWERAFTFLSDVAHKMGNLANNIDPEYSDLFHPLVDITNSLMNNKARIDVNNPDGSWEAQKTITLSTNADNNSVLAIMDDPTKQTTLMEMERKLARGGLSLTEETEINKYLNDPINNPSSSLGMRMSTILVLMASIEESPFISWHDKEFTKDKKIAYISWLTFSLPRGDRMDTPGTSGSMVRKVLREALTNFSQNLLESFSGSKHTFNSHLALINSLSKLISEYQVVSEDMLETEGKHGLFQELQGVRNWFSGVHNNIQTFKQELLATAADGKQAVEVFERNLLLLVNEDPTADISRFTPEQQTKIKTIARDYKNFLFSVNQLQVQARDRKENTNEGLDKIGVLLNITQANETQINKLRHTLQSLMRNKLLKEVRNLGQGAVVATPLLLHRDLFGAEEIFPMDIVSRFRDDIRAIASTPQEAAIKQLVRAAQKDGTKSDAELLRRIHELRTQITAGRADTRNTFAVVFNLLDTDAELDLIISAYTNILEAKPGVSSMDNSMTRIALNRARTRFTPLPSDRHDVDLLVDIFLEDTSGRTYFGNQDGASLTYHDLIQDPGLSPEQLNTIKGFVSTSLNEIGYNFLEKTAFRVVERLMIHRKMGRPGLTTRVDIMDILDSLVDQDLAPTDPDSVDNSKTRSLLLASYSRLKDALENTRGTLTREQGSGLIGVSQKYMAPLTRFILGKRITLATATVEGMMSTFGAMGANKNPVAFIWDLINEYTKHAWHDNAGGIITGDARSKDGHRLFGDKEAWITELGTEMAFALGHLASPYLAGDANLDPSGELNLAERAVRHSDRAMSLMSQSIYTVIELTHRRHIRNLLMSETNGLRALRDAYNKVKKENPGIKDLRLLQKALKIAGTNVTQAVAYKWLVTGLLDGDVIDTLENLANTYPAKDSFIAHASYMDARNTLIEAKDTVGLEKLDRAWKAYTGAAFEVSKLTITRDGPLDNTARSAASFGILSLWKSYNSLYINQQIIGNAGLMGPGRFLIQTGATLMLDMIYMMAIMLTQDEGFKKVERMLRGKDMGGLAMLALRNPIFSGNSLSYIVSLMVNEIIDRATTGSTKGYSHLSSIAESVAGREFTSIIDTIGTLFATTIGNGATPAEKRKAISTMQTYFPILGSALAKVATQPLLEVLLPGGTAMPAYAAQRAAENKSDRNKLRLMGFQPQLNRTNNTKLRAFEQEEYFNNMAGQNPASLRESYLRDIKVREEEAKQKKSRGVPPEEGPQEASRDLGTPTAPSVSQERRPGQTRGLPGPNRDPFKTASLAPNKAPAGL